MQPASTPEHPRVVPADLQADLAHCQRLLRGGSRSFWAASLLLPRAVCEPACAVYAFCRLADDDIDAQGAGPAALARWRERLALAYAGRPADHAADRAFAAVVQHHGIAPEVPEALLEGFEWDLAGRRYDSIDDLQAYAVRVAGSVGVMMALIMGARAPAALARACDLGVAMQLSNIARDVGEDARAGRLYLPQRWLHDAGIDAEAWLAAPVHSPALASVVSRLLAHADALYSRVSAGVAELPPRCRPGIQAARFLYAEIGHQVARNGHDGVNQRAVVSPVRKLACVSRALWATPRPGVALREPGPLPCARSLVRAAAAAPWPAAVAPPSRAVPAWRLDLRWLATLEMLELRARQSAPRRSRA